LNKFTLFCILATVSHESAQKHDIAFLNIKKSDTEEGSVAFYLTAKLPLDSNFFKGENEEKFVLIF